MVPGKKERKPVYSIQRLALHNETIVEDKGPPEMGLANGKHWRLATLKTWPLHASFSSASSTFDPNNGPHGFHDYSVANKIHFCAATSVNGNGMPRILDLSLLN